jgi:hypothetical protein
MVPTWKLTSLEGKQSISITIIIISDRIRLNDIEKGDSGSYLNQTLKLKALAAIYIK